MGVWEGRFLFVSFGLVWFRAFCVCLVCFALVLFACLFVLVANHPSNTNISQGRICTDSLTSCYNEIQPANQTSCLIAETGPTSPNTGWVATRLSVSSHWYDSTRGRYHGGRRPSSDDSLHSPTVIPPSALDTPSITKRYHRRRTCSHTSPRRSPTMITLHGTRFVECRWWNDGWTLKTVVTWRSSASMVPAPEVSLTRKPRMELGSAALVAGVLTTGPRGWWTALRPAVHRAWYSPHQARSCRFAVNRFCRLWCTRFCRFSCRRFSRFAINRLCRF